MRASAGLRRSLRTQRGIGGFGLLFVLALIGFFAIIAIKTAPIYLNQMKVASAVGKVAANPENAGADPRTLRNDLQSFWDIDDVQYLDVADIKVKRNEQGRFLSYSYEARERLFYNIYIVIEFADDVALPNVQS